MAYFTSFGVNNLTGRERGKIKENLGTFRQDLCFRCLLYQSVIEIFEKDESYCSAFSWS